MYHSTLNYYHQIELFYKIWIKQFVEYLYQIIKKSLQNLKNG